MRIGKTGGYPWCATLLLAALVWLAGLNGVQAVENPVPVAWTLPRVAATSPGSLLAAQPQALSVDLPHAGQRWLLSYRSHDAQQRPIVVSGYALVPPGEPPAGGWPVLAWAHGTTGVADECALSQADPAGPLASYQRLAEQALDVWLARGYVVVATDYAGLGTPGPHPYMDAQSQLRSVVDAVRAVHALLPDRLSPDWLVMGHSQGGAAALMVAAAGERAAPEYRLRAAIAAAPGGHEYAGLAEYVRRQPVLPPAVAAFLPIVLLGAQAAAPQLDVDALLAPEMQPLMQLARRRCLAELREEIRQSPRTVFRQGAELGPLLEYLARQSIERMQPAVPLLLIQGESDALVSPAGIRAYRAQLCKAGRRVLFRSIVGGSHRDALARVAELSEDFLSALQAAPHEANLSSLSNCPSP